jgi:hypothetical protein
MRLLVVGYVLLGAFLALERLLRRDEAARSLGFDTADRGTTRLLGVTFAYAFICGLRAGRAVRPLAPACDVQNQTAAGDVVLHADIEVRPGGVEHPARPLGNEVVQRTHADAAVAQ